VPSGVYIRTQKTKNSLSKSHIGKTHSQEWRQKMSKIMKGRKITWGNKIGAKIKGIKRSKETRIRISEGHKGQKAWNKGIPITEETRKKLIYFNTGRKHLDITKRKISQANKGKKPYQMTNKIREKISITKKGIKLSEETKLKISLAQRGEKGSNWQGGISNKPYSLDWSLTLKRSIRERDNYTCQICSSLQSEVAYSVHHIDYDKKNCNPNNLITLCVKCHMKTNHNRDYWEKYFKEYV